MADLTDNNWVKFIKSEGFSLEALAEDPKLNTVFQWIHAKGLRDKAIEFGESIGDEGMVKFLNHTKKKEAENKGWWDGTPLAFKTATNSIIAKNSAIIRPGTERGISLREAMWLMGLPHDFEMMGNVNNHICQNVPVKTATDWTSEVIRFLNGEITEFGGDFVKQNNISKKIDFAEASIKTAVLF
jgi:site-specific DNA-cytosine methylase